MPGRGWKILPGVLLALAAHAQQISPPAIQWQRTLGGDGSEVPVAIQQTEDGGWFVAGYSSSAVSGNKSSPKFSGTNMADFWVVRMDRNGDKAWDRSFGGTNWNVGAYLALTSDGGCVIAGRSSSPPGGSKTSLNHGGSDYWVIRLTADGQTAWERSFGGTNDDNCTGLTRTADGGFVVSGSSTSPPDANGGKTSERFGGADYWLVRLDGDGNKLWDKSYGGTGYDEHPHIQSTPDGGFICAGVSTSPANGTKTSARLGGMDVWVVRLDADGNQSWDKSFGGSSDELWTSDIAQTHDGGFIVAVPSVSPPGGNKSAPYYGSTFGLWGDMWVVRMDAAGNKLWDKSFGGTGEDLPYNIQPMADGGFLLAGVSNSGADGNKTSTNYGGSDLWLVRLDAAGEKLWEQVFGGIGSESGGACVQQSMDGGCIVAVASSGGISGNKTVPSFGSTDFWIIKLGADALSAPPHLRVVNQTAQDIQYYGYRLALSGVSNQTYRVERSSDFVTWTPFQTNRVTSGDLQVIDPETGGLLRSFYRARVVP